MRSSVFQLILFSLTWSSVYFFPHGKHFRFKIITFLFRFPHFRRFFSRKVYSRQIWNVLLRVDLSFVWCVRALWSHHTYSACHLRIYACKRNDLARGTEEDSSVLFIIHNSPPIWMMNINFSWFRFFNNNHIFINILMINPKNAYVEILSWNSKEN